MDYFDVVLENDTAIKETSDELYKILPATISVNDIQNAYLYTRKVGDNCFECSYKTWKNVSNRNFEMVSIIFTQAPTLKQCLYKMCVELEKAGSM